MKEDFSKIYEYESIGKSYNCEKACISLTSWKARINTVAKTLYSLLKQCPGFHIVLVLSKDEFPLMEKELPNNLMLFVENKLIELFWIRPNLKSFKKVLFTMDKYRDVPVIGADDDCLYTTNYAQELYNKWINHKDSIILYRNTNDKHLQGPNTLYPPSCFSINKNLIVNLNSFRKKNNSDDTFFTTVAKNNNINFVFLNHNNLPFVFHDEIAPIHPNYRHQSYFKNCYL